MRYQKIESKIWHDEKFIALTPLQQRLFFYVLTSPHSNLTGLYVLKIGYGCEDLKYLPKDFTKDLGMLIEKGLIEYDFETSVLLIRNFLKHNPITNPNQRKAVIKHLHDLPKSPLILRFIELNPDLVEALPEGLSEVLLKQEEGEGEGEGTEKGTGEGEGDRSSVPPAPTIPPFKIQDLAKLWNEIKPPELAAVNLPFRRPDHLMEKLRNRVKRYPKKDFWEKVIHRMHYSPFLRGESPDRSWKASFDFMVRKAEEILDGKYDAVKKQPKGFAGIRDWLQDRGENNA